ncbi:Anillin [Nymphon striatum]|nr:Anillin [Nymphon striatum]
MLTFPLILSATYCSYNFCPESLKPVPASLFAPPAPPAPPANIVDENGTEIPLAHTISFYRRQKDANKTPVKKLIRKDYLQGEINAQQTIISQTSQALNLCRATSEFYGSSEQIEGERLLLIATQKRQACLDEITCLKTEGAMMDVKHSINYNESEGVLTISDIRLPLKHAFVVAVAEGKHGQHGPQVIATEMISTQQGTLSSGSLTFSNMITIHNLESDFSVIFEVYGLVLVARSPEEFCPIL